MISPTPKMADSKSLCDDRHPLLSELPQGDTLPKYLKQDYDFVEEPPQEYFCPVTFELLRDPKQTECCGHHLSGNVVTRLQLEGKPCPLCTCPNFAVTNDKYFKRKVEELKVLCPHKQNGCKWEGELGNSDQHAKSCPERPWQCQYCDFRGTYDVGITNHLPSCTKYPELCPNQCDIGAVPRCDMEKHLTECPLQLVECEFAQAGCCEKIPRQDLSRHMEEGFQCHLLNMSLLNLSLTKELHQKMDEEDQQIAKLQEQLQEQNRKLEERFKQFAITQTQLQNENKVLQISLLQGNIMQTLLQQCKNIPSSLLTAKGFRPPIECTLRRFSLHQAKGGRGLWLSDPFYSYHGGYKFQLGIDTNGYKSVKGTHITADLYPQRGEENDKLSWPIKVTAYLQLLNQWGDHGHVVATLTAEVNRDMIVCVEFDRKFIAHSELGYNAAKDTQYLKDDCLHFRLYLSCIFG